MDERAAQLRRRISFYRKNLEEGVSTEIARQHLQAIAELEMELARLKPPPKGNLKT